MGTWRRLARDNEATNRAAAPSRRREASREVALVAAERAEAPTEMAAAYEKTADEVAERAEAATERAAACEESFMQWPIGRLHQLRELMQP